jgi:hypothetical protein
MTVNHIQSRKDLDDLLMQTLILLMKNPGLKESSLGPHSGLMNKENDPVSLTTSFMIFLMVTR